MTLSDLITPERVREIAESVRRVSSRRTVVAESAINAAAPEIARAALEMAAKRLDDEDSTNASAIVRAFAKELTPTKIPGGIL